MNGTAPFSGASFCKGRLKTFLPECRKPRSRWKPVPAIGCRGLARRTSPKVWSACLHHRQPLTGYETIWNLTSRLLVNHSECFASPTDFNYAPCRGRGPKSFISNLHHLAPRTYHGHLQMKPGGKIEATKIHIINDPALGRPSNRRIRLTPHWPARHRFKGSTYA